MPQYSDALASPAVQYKTLVHISGLEPSTAFLGLPPTCHGLPPSFPLTFDGLPPQVHLRHLASGLYLHFSLDDGEEVQTLVEEGGASSNQGKVRGEGLAEEERPSHHGPSEEGGVGGEGHAMDGSQLTSSIGELASDKVQLRRLIEAEDGSLPVRASLHRHDADVFLLGHVSGVEFREGELVKASVATLRPGVEALELAAAHEPDTAAVQTAIDALDLRPMVRTLQALVFFLIRSDSF